MISPAELNLENEIYQEWDSEFKRWHDRVFSNTKPSIEVDSYSVLKEILKNSEHWTILQESNVCILRKSMPIQIYTLTDAPPSRTCYMLTNRFPDKKSIPLLRQFKELLLNESSKFRL